MITNFVSQGYIEGNDNCQFSMEEFFLTDEEILLILIFSKQFAQEKLHFSTFSLNISLSMDPSKKVYKTVFRQIQ